MQTFVCCVEASCRVIFAVHEAEGICLKIFRQTRF
jgi:hypothetical protein